MYDVIKTTCLGTPRPPTVPARLLVTWEPLDSADGPRGARECALSNRMERGDTRTRAFSNNTCKEILEPEGQPEGIAAVPTLAGRSAHVYKSMQMLWSRPRGVFEAVPHKMEGFSRHSHNKKVTIINNVTANLTRSVFLGPTEVRANCAVVGWVVEWQPSRRHATCGHASQITHPIPRAH